MNFVKARANEEWFTDMIADNYQIGIDRRSDGKYRTVIWWGNEYDFFVGYADSFDEASKLGQDELRRIANAMLSSLDQ